MLIFVLWFVRICIGSVMWFIGCNDFGLNGWLVNIP